MSNLPASLVQYLAAWNELDPSKIRRHLDRSCAQNVLFIDPANTTGNIDELETMIINARAERPTATYHRTTGVDGHNLRYRYDWEVRLDGKALMHGMDVTTLNDQGEIVQIDGFFGTLPELEV